MTRRAKPARYRLVAHPAVPADLVALAAYGPRAVVAARTALDDLAHGRVTGKTLGDRHISGDARGVVAIGVRDEHAIYRLAAERIQRGPVAPDAAEGP
ncbi:MAG: hypothetical protein M1134_03385 [Actinobacteria bacterium]|nr:hypothetical protein [Actinomycetota bacterium]